MIGASRVICVDGPAGSGKTTLAHTLSTLLGGKVIHMDSLYGGWSQALVDDTWKRVHELLVKLRAEGRARPQFYDWHTEVWREGDITLGPCLIIEGVGAAHPLVTQFADDLIWVEVRDTNHLERVVSRDGEQVREPMRTFMKEQDLYFSKFNVEARANLRLITASGTV